ncbi:MAG: hypothetical protein NTY20_04360 [Candidatus Aenigmarchaeota archaeon]|nr:hypothetical protein [Candidatus Aenigmarchaeota archaeon]
MEGGRPGKFSLFLILLGFIIGIIGAAAAFAWSAGFVVLFYLGFFIAIIGFAFAVYSELKEKK